MLSLLATGIPTSDPVSRTTAPSKSYVTVSLAVPCEGEERVLMYLITHARGQTLDALMGLCGPSLDGQQGVQRPRCIPRPHPPARSQDRDNGAPRKPARPSRREAILQQTRRRKCLTTWH
jgi:hypothetical protein